MMLLNNELCYLDFLKKRIGVKGSGAQRLSICWVHSLNARSSQGLGQAESRSLKLHLGLALVCQGSRYLRLL